MFRLGVYDGYNKSSQQSQAYLTLLTVVESVVLVSNRRPGKDFSCIYKVEAMAVNICLTLRLIPGKSHS